MTKFEMYDRVTVLNDDPASNMLGTVVGWANYLVHEGDFTTMDSPGTMRQCVVVALDYSDQGWLDNNKHQSSHISHLMVDAEALEPAPWFVNVYELDRAYGGPEEGGWWYDVRTPVHSVIAANKQDAERMVERLSEEYPAEGERSIYSVVYNGGAHDVRIENHPPVAEPQNIPHYE
jgi:hypothetical protein